MQEQRSRYKTDGATVTGKVQPFKSSVPIEPTRVSQIPLLDAINHLITAEEEDEGWDLLRDDMKRRGTHSTVGIRLAQNSSAVDLRPCNSVCDPRQFGTHMRPAQRGDEIIAVNGQTASEQDIVRQVRGTDILGSKVVLTVRKGGFGQEFDVSLVRRAWGAVERKRNSSSSLMICTSSSGQTPAKKIWRNS